MDSAAITFIAIGIFAIVVLVVRSILMKKEKGTVARPRKIHSSPKTVSLSKSPHSAKSIILGKNACEAVKVLGGTRFLIRDNDIPKLPLPHCDAVGCACTYKRQEDRRDEVSDRRTPYHGLKTQLYQRTEKMDRREKIGRRASDWEFETGSYA
jgi:hypothetical protein